MRFHAQVVAAILAAGCSSRAPARGLPAGAAPAAVASAPPELAAPPAPDSVDRLAARGGVTARRVDLRPVTGGILHAKYFVVDDREAWATAPCCRSRRVDMLGGRCGLRSRSSRGGFCWAAPASS